jgi:hypothetical protein
MAFLSHSFEARYRLALARVAEPNDETAFIEHLESAIYFASLAGRDAAQAGGIMPLYFAESPELTYGFNAGYEEVLVDLAVSALGY